jgi:hypothetical protein
MKRILIAFLLCFAFLCPYSSLAQSADSAGGTEQPPVAAESAQTRTSFAGTKPAMDSVSLLMGVYNPLDEEMKGIYGGMFSLGAQYSLNMSGPVDLLLSIGLMRNSGNPYYNIPTFSSGKSSDIQIIPMEISIRRRMAFMRNPSGSVSRGFYAGAGVNYVRVSEEISEFLSASGGDFGLQVFAGPQIFFTESFVFEGEVKLLMSSVDMKHEDRKYPITLSGLVIRAVLSWYY